MTVALRMPGSKSQTHRAYLLAAQSERPCTVTDPLRGADTDATLGCLHRLGHRFGIEERAVAFLPSNPAPPMESLDCRNAGTALRLLMGTVARHPFPSVLDGDASLRGRPNRPLIEALRTLGANVRGDDTAPLTVSGPISPGNVALPARTSSQFASSLLLSLPMLDGPSTLQLEPPVSSRPYIDLTLDVAAHFGLRIEPDGDTFHIPGGDRPAADHVPIEGDWSTAAFPLVAAAITGTSVRLDGLRPDSRQGDRVILDHLSAFGCTVSSSEHVEVHGGPLESPGSIDVAATPDMFPALCILAANARGTTTFTGGHALRSKESDRIRAMAAGLAACGVTVQEHEDGLTVQGGRLSGGSVHAFDDHRIHMAFAVANLAADGNVEVDGADSARVSYPGFHADLAALQEAA